MKPLRRLRRVLRVCVFGFLLFLILTAGGVWLAHRHLTRIAVEAFNRTFPELELTASTVGLSPAGVLDLKTVRLRNRRDGSTALSIPSAQVRFAWNELRQQLVREIIIDQVSVRVGDSLWSSLGLPLVEGSGVSEPSLPWRIGRLTVKRGEARVELTGQPTLSTGFSLDMAEGGVASANQLILTDLRIRQVEGREEILSVSSLRVSASPDDLRRGRLRELAIEGPQLRIDDRVLALLPKKSGESKPIPAWVCDRFSLRQGNVHLDFAQWPKTDFNVTVRAEQIATEGAGAFEISLSGVGVQLREENTRALTVAGIRVAGTVGGLMRQSIQEIEIDQPKANVTDRVLAWRPPAMATVPSTSAPAQAAPLSGKVERLSIKGGGASIDLEGAPLAEFAFGARLQNAGLGAESAEELQSVEVLDFALRPRVEGMEPFLRIPAIRAEFRLPELVEKRRLARLRIEHLDFRYNTAFREMIASGAKPAPVRATPPQSVTSSANVPVPTIGELRLVDGRLHLDDLGVGIPGIECRLETAFRELAVEPGGGQGGQELQTIELSQIALRSPLDPFVTVLDLDTVFVRFTLAGLWARNIDEVAIVRPTLAIGPDLFWYIDRVQKNQEAPPGSPPPVDDGPPWTIDRFSAKSGQLLLALEGQAKLALPMPFESRARNLNFRRLSDLRLKLQIDMPEQDYDYPSYELALRGVSGRVEFALPPRKGNNNVVNTLRMKGVRWKNFSGRDLFLDVTYDERGVYGNLTGRGYSGILRGQFNFLLTPESDWDGWVAGTGIDLKPITNALAPEKFSLSSPADFRLSVKARAREILKVDGDFKATRAGEMRIGKLDDFIRDLPGDWSGVKRGLSRISLETLRDFSYDTAHGAFNFIGLIGAVHLDLRGPDGSRKIEMNFREADSSTPKSRVATTQP